VREKDPKGSILAIMVSVEEGKDRNYTLREKKTEEERGVTTVLWVILSRGVALLFLGIPLSKGQFKGMGLRGSIFLVFYRGDDRKKDEKKVVTFKPFEGRCRQENRVNSLGPPIDRKRWVAVYPYRKKGLGQESDQGKL